MDGIRSMLVDGIDKAVAANSFKSCFLAQKSGWKRTGLLEFEPARVRVCRVIRTIESGNDHAVLELSFTDHAHDLGHHTGFFQFYIGDSAWSEFVEHISEFGNAIAVTCVESGKLRVG